MSWRQTMYKDIDPDDEFTGNIWTNDQYFLFWDSINVRWLINSFPASPFVIYNSLGYYCNVTGGGGTLETGYYTPVYQSMNGKRFYAYPRINFYDYLWFLWWFADFAGADPDSESYIISKGLGVAKEEYWDAVDGEYKGDEWWSRSGDLEGTYLARGSLRGAVEGAYNGPTATAEKKYINIWEKAGLYDEMAGIYTAIEGGMPDIEVGYNEMEITGNISGGGTEVKTLLSFSEYAGEKVYGTEWYVWHDGANWILTDNPPPAKTNGWWSGPASAFGVFNVWNEGVVENPAFDDTAYSSFVSTDEGFVVGDDKATVYIAEVGKWAT